MSDKIITNENYIKSLFKSHKEIRDSYLSRYSQAVERINEMENEVIYSTSVPGMDYSNTSINTSSINDSTFNAVSKLDKFRKTESIYKELSWLRTKLDEIDIIFDIPHFPPQIFINKVINSLSTVVLAKLFVL